MTALSAAAGLVPLFGAQVAAAATVPAAGASPAVEVCGQGSAVVKPSSMIMTCADSGEIATGLNWTSWSATQATATGTVTWRTGAASLSASRDWSSAAADLTLSSPVAEPDGTVLFTGLSVQVTGSTPSGFNRVQTFNEAPLPAAGASASASASTSASTSASAAASASAASGAASPDVAASPAAASGTLGYAQIEGFWVDAGGPSSVADIAAAITGAESSFLPGIIQQDVAYCGAGANRAGWGLWQITCGNEEPAYGVDFQMLDPWNNAEAAVSLYDSRGFEPWTTYETGAYRNFLRTNVADDNSLLDPGQYKQDGSTPSGTPTSAAPGSTAGPALNPYLALFEDSSADLYSYVDMKTAKGSNAGTSLGMDAGTSPAAAGLSNGNSYITAFQDNKHDLYLHNSSGANTPTTLVMDAGTSPAIAALSGDKWEAAFQSSGNFLGLRSSTGAATITKLGMDAGTSPAIAGVGGGWVAAFQENHNDLYVLTSGNAGVKLNLGMKAGTSPSIARLSDGGFAIAFEANTGHLYTYVTKGTTASDIEHGTGTLTQYGMDAAGSPAIASFGNGWEVAFQTNTHDLYTYLSNKSVTKSTLGMDAGTRPSIAVEPDGSQYVIAFQNNLGKLYLHTSLGANTSTGLGMRSGSSPAISTPYPAR